MKQYDDYSCYLNMIKMETLSGGITSQFDILVPFLTLKVPPINYDLYHVTFSNFENMSDTYSQVHFRLDFFMEANNTNPDQTAPKGAV